MRGLDSGFHLVGSHQHGRGHDQASSSSCLPSPGFDASSASARLWRGHRNGSELSLFGLFEPGSAHPLCTCWGCCGTAPCLLISAASSSLSGMLRLRRSRRRTDLSWPKNTVNILGSVLCSLMVQAANTPKPTSYTQSLAPKEILCLHHMKSWIRIQSRGEKHRERKDIGGWQGKEPKHAELDMSCWKSHLGVKPTGVEAGFEAAQASLLVLMSSWSRVRVAETIPAPGADFSPTSPAMSPCPGQVLPAWLCPHHTQTQFISCFLVTPS